jgi:alanine racemase
MIKKYAKKAVKYLSNNGYKTLNWIEISRSNIIHNFDMIQKLHPSYGIMTVLKSNAYGHGLEQVTSVLNEVNCCFIAVDGYYEASKIKDLTRHKILVMGYILPDNIHLLDFKKCSFVIQDKEGLIALSKLNKRINVHVELNTGMNRLGLQPNELVDYLETIKKYSNLNLEGVMTHLADADNDTDTNTNNQTELFDQLIEKIIDYDFRPKYIHIAQTAGSAKVISKYANSLRLGIGLYGVNPLLKSDCNYNKLSKLMPVLELKSTVIKVLDLEKGQKISYNGIYTTSTNTKVGVLPLGYYEGVPRELSSIGFVSYGNEALPIVGRVCMNHTMIDISNTKVKFSDVITVISNNNSMPNSIQNISNQFGLFTYTLMTDLSESIRRAIVK